jgi:hypothetical protein
LTYTQNEIKCEIQSVRLHARFAELYKIANYQMLVSVSVKRTNQKLENIISQLERELNGYKEKAPSTTSMIEISIMQKKITYYDITLFIFFQLPESETVKEYYSNSKICTKEFQFHLYQMYDIRCLTRKIGCPVESLLKKNNSLGLFFNSGSPFPSIYITPMIVINKYVNCTMNSSMNDNNLNQCNQSNQISQELNNCNSCENITISTEQQSQMIWYNKLLEILTKDEISEKNNQWN